MSVIFAGNIGRFQGLDTVVEAMARLTRRADIEFIMMGDGAARAALEVKAREAGARIWFIGHQSVEVAKAAMRNVDFGFVSLVPGMFRYAYPSKTMTYLEQGCPLIVSVEPESELARDVLAEEYGYTVDVGNSRELAGLLERLADNDDWKPALRRNAYRKARKDFSEPVVLDQWSRLLSEPGIGAR